MLFGVFLFGLVWVFLFVLVWFGGDFCCCCFGFLMWLLGNLKLRTQFPLVADSESPSDSAGPESVVLCVLQNATLQWHQGSMNLGQAGPGIKLLLWESMF